MATIPHPQPTGRTKEELAVELLDLMEGYFDDAGLTESQREERYAALKNSLDEKDAVRAIS